MKSNNFLLKKALLQLKDELAQQFHQKIPITTITNKLVTGIDELIVTLFQKFALDSKEVCLLATGGYGRRELQLHSDIDLLLLHSDPLDEKFSNQAQLFIQACWDTGLEISHQITTVADCANLASQNVSTISSILDMRLLCGRYSLMEELLYQTHSLHIWPSHEYFYAKEQEQRKRYEKYGETAYNLEPNVKNGAGGLRDIQILLNISKRHFGIKKLSDGISFGFITAKEYDELAYCQQFLWRVRFALHTLADKKEDRLLFNYQPQLARLFDYEDNSTSLAIEQFMKTYFKVIKRSRELNEMLLQWFAETIIYHQKQRIIPLNNSFQLSNQYIEVRHAKIFINRPQAILEIFLWMANHPDIKGIRTNTIRLIRQHLFLIDKKFCSMPTVHQIFLKLFKVEHNPYEALQRMSRYGVLGYYLECFALITGQMQYDLFHVYTVDQHTLFVIRNIARFLDSDFEQQFPLCHQLISNLHHREILYLAAFFHDIAKGRGGDHSELGAQEALNFARQHKLEHVKESLLVWLVENHLLMSLTAQRQDIYDPETMDQFCNRLPAIDYLDYLYLLTVADICATNPSLWNAWKDSLLKELYYTAKQTMAREKNKMDEATLVNQRLQEAGNILAKQGIAFEMFYPLWQSFKNKYFLHESPEIIAHHTKAILQASQFPLVMILPHHSEGGTEIFIYMPHRDERFIITTTVLSNHQITIQEASILTCDNNYDLDTYIILDEQTQSLLSKKKTSIIERELMKWFSNDVSLPVLHNRRLTRIQAHFKNTPKISFSKHHNNNLTKLFLVTADRPGLLAQISRIFLNDKIHLHTAKIATAGERVEDMFYISNQSGKSLNAEEQERLEKHLLNELS